MEELGETVGGEKKLSLLADPYLIVCHNVVLQAGRARQRRVGLSKEKTQKNRIDYFFFVCVAAREWKEKK